MWAYESVFYQIYPLGFCGAPFENDGVLEHRINKVSEWIPHIKKLGANAIYFSPLFESDTHGYNTRDYCMLDKRLGTNEDFKNICQELHENGIKIVLDGVFNHVGRGILSISGCLKEIEKIPDIKIGSTSVLKEIPIIMMDFGMKAGKVHYDLVKLNLGNEEVVQHILNAVKFWIDEFDIDGIRLDVAYCLSPEFLS